MSEWRYIAEYPATCRLEVPGGWIYRVPSDSGAALFVPDPEWRSTLFEQGHKAGYMQALANHDKYEQQGDKVKPADEHTQYQVGYEEGWQAAASASNTVQLDKASPNYEEGYNRGFSDALNGYECEPKGDKVKPFDPDVVVRKLHEAMDLYQDGEPTYARQRIDDIIEMLEGK